MGVTFASTSARRERDRLSATLGVVLILGTIAVLAWARPDRAHSRASSMAWLALGSFLLAVVTVRSTSAGGWLSVPSIYLYVFGAFHLGLAPMVAMGWKVPDFGGADATTWMTTRPLADALFSVAVAMLVYALGARIGASMPQRRRPPATTERSAPEARSALAAFLIALAGVGGWYLFVFSRGGIALFTASYTQYLDATAGGFLPLLYLMLGLAGALWAVTPSHPLSRRALLLLVLFAIPALPLGLRGEVLFPLAAGVAVLAKRRRLRVRPVPWLMVVVLVLSGIALIRTVRTTGIAGATTSVDVNPVHGLAELGFSLRPVAEAISWRVIDPPAGGRTYLRPIQRAAARVIPSIDVPPATQDRYIATTLIVQRVGPVGFSPVAEGIVNFGLAGAAGYMLVVGVLLGWLDRRPSTVSGLVLTSVVLVPLLIEVRNSFVSLPLQLVLGLMVWAAVFRPRRAGPAIAADGPLEGAAEPVH